MGRNPVNVGDGDERGMDRSQKDTNRQNRSTNSTNSTKRDHKNGNGGIGAGSGRKTRNGRGGGGGGSTRLPPRQQEVITLNGRIDVETPARGSVAHGKNTVVRFDSLPLSQATILGLQDCGYTTMTEIQSGSIPHALAGRDILGAAKTGSGKTLAFLVPLLERLYRNGYTPQDGVGAIILSPTRELAGQIFAVLRKVGKYHSVSLGLLMGGRHKNHKAVGEGGQNDFHREQQALPTTNVLVCTPGRLLQHLEQTPYFNVDGLQMLVLDEADRILDMGFRDQLLQILDYLPKGGDDGDSNNNNNHDATQQRQTLLFSATQTKDVKHLATLSINHRTVEYVGVHDQDAQTTPERLKQTYVVVPLQHKLDCLYSFIKSHLKHKTITFFATCSQVRHAWDLFCRLRPGLSVLALHGKLSQTKRLQVYDKFTTTPHCVLFATDVASRGLDFPYVDWVVQVDAPEDYDMYVHRVGRTARFHQDGQALLLLDPSEETPFIHNPKCHDALRGARIVKKTINPTKTMIVTQRAASLVAEHAPLYSLAKKAFWSYIRSTSLLPRDGPTAIWTDLRPIQDMTNLEAFALSLGLPNIPGDVQTMLDGLTSRDALRKTKNVNRKLQKLKEQIRLEKEERRKAKKRESGESIDDDDDDADDGATAKKEDRENDDLLVIKARHDAEDIGNDVDVPLSSLELRKSKRIRIDSSNSNQNKHIVFEEDGTEQPKLLRVSRDDDNDDDSDSSDSDDNVDGSDKNKRKLSKLQSANEAYLEQVRQRLEQTKELDKQEERERIRAKHKKKRLQEKMERTGNDDKQDNVNVATLDTAATMTMDEESDDEELPTNKDGSGDDNDSSSEDSSTDDSDSDEDDDSVDVAQQEDLALSLIRGAD